METYHMEENERLRVIRDIQIAEMELIRLFAEICEKEHLMYYMLGGTMLGAIRHKGYIPWDDDSDFGMPRKDYEMFQKIAKKYLTKETQLSVFNEKDPYNYKYYARLLSKKKKIEISGVLEKHEIGVWIDIFPLDGMPENPVIRLLHKVRLMILRKGFLLSNFTKDVALNNPHRSLYNRFGVFVCKCIPIYRLISSSKAWKRLDRALKSYSYEKSTYTLNMMGAYKFREMFRKEIFGDGIFYDFEGMKLRGPQNYDFYLTQLYGDYMTPPPETERNKHNTRFVER